MKGPGWEHKPSQIITIFIGHGKRLDAAWRRLEAGAILGLDPSKGVQDTPRSRPSPIHMH